MNRYLVKWLDLSYKDCTWESIEEISDKDLLLAYEKRQIIPPFKLEPPQPRAVRVARGEKAILQFKDNKVSIGIENKFCNMNMNMNMKLIEDYYWLMVIYV